MLACCFIFSNSTGLSFPGLFKMYSGIASFPSVVQQGGGLDRLNETFIGHAKTFCQTHRIGLHTSNMTMSDLIFCVDRHRQSLYRR